MYTTTTTTTITTRMPEEEYAARQDGLVHPHGALLVIPSSTFAYSKNPSNRNNKEKKLYDWYLCECKHYHHIAFSESMSQHYFDIGVGTLSKCAELTSVDLCGLRSVTRIGGNFLAECPCLCHVDTSAFRNLKVVGDGFLLRSGMTSVDLSGLSTATHIGGNFLAQSHNLVNVQNLSTAFQSVATGAISDWFLFESGVTSVDLTGHACSHITKIDRYFMYDCTNLRSLNLSSSSSSSSFLSTNIEEIGDSFLFRSGVTSVDLSGLSNVTRVGSYFLTSCPNIETLDVTAVVGGEGKNKRIGQGFLFGSGMTSIQL
eukprot:PhM_4_TR13182/c0_g1_i1/m.81810